MFFFAIFHSPPCMIASYRAWAAHPLSVSAPPTLSFHISNVVPYLSTLQTHSDAVGRGMKLTGLRTPNKHKEKESKK